jgi:hypothetical protein
VSPQVTKRFIPATPLQRSIWQPAANRHISVNWLTSLRGSRERGVAGKLLARVRVPPDLLSGKGRWTSTHGDIRNRHLLSGFPSSPRAICRLRHPEPQHTLLMTGTLELGPVIAGNKAHEKSAFRPLPDV